MTMAVSTMVITPYSMHSMELSPFVYTKMPRASSQTSSCSAVPRVKKSPMAAMPKAAI